MGTAPYAEATPSGREPECLAWCWCSQHHARHLSQSTSRPRSTVPASEILPREGCRVYPGPFSTCAPRRRAGDCRAARVRRRGATAGRGREPDPADEAPLAAPAVVVDVGRLTALAGITRRDGYLAIGALTHHADVEDDAAAGAALPLLRDVAACIGDTQVRNVGTVGGALAEWTGGAGDPRCWPSAAACAPWAPPASGSSPPRTSSSTPTPPRSPPTSYDGGALPPARPVVRSAHLKFEGARGRLRRGELRRGGHAGRRGLLRGGGDRARRGRPAARARGRRGSAAARAGADARPGGRGRRGRAHLHRVLRRRPRLRRLPPAPRRRPLRARAGAGAARAPLGGKPCQQAPPKRLARRPWRAAGASASPAIRAACCPWRTRSAGGRRCSIGRRRSAPSPSRLTGVPTRARSSRGCCWSTSCATS